MTVYPKSGAGMAGNANFTFSPVMQTILNLYRNAYGGLSLSSWMLALVMFINRAARWWCPS
jgi:hypothetical protein